MIKLVSESVTHHCFFARQNGQIMFRWSISTPDGSRCRSDWQSLSHAKGLDSNLIREFTSRFGAWSALREKDSETTNSYLVAYKQATLAGRHFVPPNDWADLHQAYTPFLACQRTLVEQLAIKHPSADFCYVRPDDQNPEASFFAVCHGRLWSSAEWIAPAIWVEQAEQLFPNAAVADDGNSRSIASEVRREVWRRDLGRCSRCGSRARLEFDHIIPVAKGGSNTVRNIELLCEVCNRQKSASV